MIKYARKPQSLPSSTTLRKELEPIALEAFPSQEISSNFFSN
ncbi:MAG: hypothetical protein ACKO6C_07045 [Alphaproteobacteria bacterium]